MGRPVVRKEPYTRRSVNFDDDLWEKLVNFASGENKSVTEVLHEFLYGRISSIYFPKEGEGTNEIQV